MKTWLRITLIVMSVGGGSAGVFVTVPLVFAADQIFLNRLLAFVFVILYGFIVTSGLLFIHRPEETTPLKVALALQIFWLSMPSFTYYLASGAYFFVRFGGMDVDRIGFSLTYSLGSRFTINFSGEHWNFGINLFAAGLLYLLEKSDKANKSAEAARSIANPVKQSDVTAS